jgi:hypothetical protein
MRYRLQVQHNEEFGYDGAIIISPKTKVRNYHDPVMGLGIAHDIIEHPALIHEDPYIDELMALGAMLAGRGENSLYEEYALLRDEVENLLRSYPYSLIAGSAYQKNKRIQDHDLVNNRITQSVKDAIYNAELDEDDSPLEVDENLIISWIGEGYTRYKKRFGHLDLYNISNHVFDSIKEKVDGWVKNSDIGYEAVLIVEFNKYHVDLLPMDY